MSHTLSYLETYRERGRGAEGAEGTPEHVTVIKCVVLSGARAHQVSVEHLEHGGDVGDLLAVKSRDQLLHHLGQLRARGGPSPQGFGPNQVLTQQWQGWS